MGQIDNLNQGQIAALIGRIEKLERGSPVNNAAIGRSGLTVYGGGVITIDNGGLYVTGTAEVIGTLLASGIITLTGTLTQSGPSTFTGAVSITGPLTVTGATHLNGVTDIAGNTTVTGDFTTNGPMKTTGTLDVEGVTTLKNDLNIVGDGKIVAGQTTIRPSGNINFGDSLTIGPDFGTGIAEISAGASQIMLTPGDPIYWAQFTGGAFFQGRVRAMDLRLESLPTTSQPANLYIDGSGFVMRSTA